ncbi:hypothetical protein CORC01_02997 [Colletotrichum orchidophilum]|uniref:Uncharacterized protein n=1 Tax=Colletotrichum orchidophilum TaxID=1209926 RepID=A0A1G4BKH3_9PEZI|nr:uncharacterized protein CORC01_02997 [Colletotrichum orchidophilum]OHF01806.1 hypothetical protein CORC01_02997 [Colletotrichum orchidophilum]
MKVVLFFSAALLGGIAAAPTAAEHQIAKAPPRIYPWQNSTQTLQSIRDNSPSCNITSTHVHRSDSEDNCSEVDACRSKKAPISRHEIEKFNVTLKPIPKFEPERPKNMEKRQCHPCCTDPEESKPPAGYPKPLHPELPKWGCKDLAADCSQCGQPPEWEWVIPGGANDKNLGKD